MSVGSQLTLGFGTIIGATIVTGVVAAAALNTAVREKDEVARESSADLARVENLRYRAEQVVSNTGNIPAADLAFQSSWRKVQGESLRELQDLEGVQEAWQRYLDAVREDQPLAQSRQALESSLDALVEDEHREQDEAYARTRASARKAVTTVALTTLIAVAASLMLAMILRRRLDEQFRRQVQAVAARDEVLAVVSHDLRNPLASIMLTSRLGARRSEPRSTSYFERVYNAADRMNHLIDELVETVRIESGGLKLAVRRCDLKGLVSKTVELFEDQAAQKEVRFKASVPERLEVDADPQRVGRVLSNLFGNALKYTPPGGEISITALPEQAAARISIHDTGPGIPPEQVPHLFEKHWQARKDRGEGLGLGLYIVKSLVEAHGGSVDVSSTPGSGSTFSFTLPR